MKFMSVAVAALLSAVTATAGAQETTGPDAEADSEAVKSRNYSRGYGTLTLGVFSLEDAEATIDGFGPIGELDTDPSSSVSLLVGYRLSRFVSVEGEIGSHSVSWNDIDASCDAGPLERCLDEQIGTLAITGNAVLSAPMESRFRPYVGVGSGWMRTSYNLENVDGSTGFGFIAKVGADVAITDTVRLGGQYLYLGSPEAEFDDAFTIQTAGGAFSVTITAGF